MKKIAFCFATYDNLSHPKIWEDFFAQADPKQYVILTHAKHPEAVNQDFIRNHLIPEYHETAWGSIKVTRLWQRMFEIAFQDPLVYKAINITQSHIPINNFAHVYE